MSGQPSQSVGVDDQLEGQRRSKENVVVQGAMQGVHVKAHMLDNIGDVGPSEDEVLESPDE